MCYEGVSFREVRGEERTQDAGHKTDGRGDGGTVAMLPLTCS